MRKVDKEGHRIMRIKLLNHKIILKKKSHTTHKVIAIREKCCMIKNQKMRIK